MLRQMKKNPYLMLLSGLTMGLLVGVGMLIGVLAAGRGDDSARLRETRSGFQLPETLLNATATQSTDTFAVATGPVSDDMEGLFTLDYLSGDLRCFLLNSKVIGAWGGLYEYNVINDLGLQPGKTPKFLMVTGMGNFSGRTGATSAIAKNLGGSLVYIVDANTGNFAVYGVPIDRNMANRGLAQSGNLVRLALGKAKGVEVGQ